MSLAYVHNKAFIYFLSQTAVLGLRLFFPFQNLFWTFMLSEGRFFTVENQKIPLSVYFWQSSAVRRQKRQWHIAAPGARRCWPKAVPAAPGIARRVNLVLHWHLMKPLSLLQKERVKKNFQVGTLHSISFKVRRQICWFRAYYWFHFKVCSPCVSQVGLTSLK